MITVNGNVYVDDRRSLFHLIGFDVLILQIFFTAVLYSFVFWVENLQVSLSLYGYQLSCIGQMMLLRSRLL